MACRRRHRRLWASRLLLESMCHEVSSFVTLTYAEGSCPQDLSPEHLRDFLKRLRRRLYPAHVRFFGVGEYGSRTQRPHYHLALFGYPPCSTVYAAGLLKGECQCTPCSVVRKAWGFGHVLVGTLEAKSAQYIARYVLKKMTRRDDLRLSGRHPEFVRMSLRPGIGAPAVEAVSRSLQSVLVHRKLNDVPLTIRVGPTQYLLGRYIRTLLRKKLFGDGAQAILPKTEQLSIVRAYAWENCQSVSSVYAELFSDQDYSIGHQEVL